MCWTASPSSAHGRNAGSAPPCRYGAVRNRAARGSASSPCRKAWGHALADAKTFTVSAVRGSTENGICSAPFLEENFRTERFTMTVTVHDEDSWSYTESTILRIKGVEAPFDHADSNRLVRIGPAEPNPLAQERR